MHTNQQTKCSITHKHRSTRHGALPKQEVSSHFSQNVHQGQRWHPHAMTHIHVFKGCAFLHVLFIQQVKLHKGGHGVKISSCHTRPRGDRRQRLFRYHSQSHQRWKFCLEICITHHTPHTHTLHPLHPLHGHIVPQKQTWMHVAHTIAQYTSSMVGSRQGDLTRSLCLGPGRSLCNDPDQPKPLVLVSTHANLSQNSTYWCHWSGSLERIPCTFLPYHLQQNNQPHLTCSVLSLSLLSPFSPSLSHLPYTTKWLPITAAQWPARCSMAAPVTTCFTTLKFPGIFIRPSQHHK